MLTQVRPDTTVRGAYSAFSPKVALAYAVSANSNAYLSYARGFRAGGINPQRLPAGAQQTFDPEHSDNYEVGYKTQSANRKFSFNASAFLIEWQRIQFYRLVAPLTYGLGNVGNARSAGVELEASAIPARGLQLDGSAGLLATRYDDFSLSRVVDYATGAESTTAIGGNKLANAPAHTLYLAAQYERPLTGPLKGLLRGEFRSIGRAYTDSRTRWNSPLTRCLTPVPGSAAAATGCFCGDKI